MKDILQLYDQLQLNPTNVDLLSQIIAIQSGLAIEHFTEFPKEKSKVYFQPYDKTLFYYNDSKSKWLTVEQYFISFNNSGIVQQGDTLKLIDYPSTHFISGDVCVDQVILTSSQNIDSTIQFTINESLISISQLNEKHDCSFETIDPKNTTITLQQGMIQDPYLSFSVRKIFKPRHYHPRLVLQNDNTQLNFSISSNIPNTTHSVDVVIIPVNGSPEVTQQSINIVKSEINQHVLSFNSMNVSFQSDPQQNQYQFDCVLKDKEGVALNSLTFTQTL